MPLLEFPRNVQSVNASVASNADNAPPVVPAVLPVNVQLVSVGLGVVPPREMMNTAPPLKSAAFPTNTQLMIFGLPASRKIAPPSDPALATKVQCAIVFVPLRHKPPT